MKVAGLFSGIGGFEVAFENAGFESSIVSDNDRAARAVLEANFKNAKLMGDVRDLRALPRNLDVICAGFPCQDLSSSGQKVGIDGDRSSVVSHLFRLLRQKRVEWVVLENVKFMLYLKKGEAMQTILTELENLGYQWAYRVVSTESFGLPQRRHRIFIVASLSNDPRKVLFADENSKWRTRYSERAGDVPIGFYWTEGTYSTGISYGAIPPLKGGSGLGIPSSPAILMRNGMVGTPTLADAERLQGFRVGWTEAASKVVRNSIRWKLLGNAVSVPVAKWVAKRIRQPGEILELATSEIGNRWPCAAWSNGKVREAVELSDSPLGLRAPIIDEFLQEPVRPLSRRAVSGFLSRAKKGRLRYPEGFLDTLETYMREAA